MAKDHTMKKTSDPKVSLLRKQRAALDTTSGLDAKAVRDVSGAMNAIGT